MANSDQDLIKKALKLEVKIAKHLNKLHKEIDGNNQPDFNIIQHWLKEMYAWATQWDNIGQKIKDSGYDLNGHVSKYFEEVGSYHSLVLDQENHVREVKRKIEIENWESWNYEQRELLDDYSPQVMSSTTRYLASYLDVSLH